MRSAYGPSDLIEKVGSQESLVLKSMNLKGRGMELVIVLNSQFHDVDLKGTGRMLPTRKMRSTS